MAKKRQMSGRERLWAVLTGDEPDRIPWSPLVNGYYLMGHPKYPNITELEAYHEMRADVLLRLQLDLGVVSYVDSPDVKQSIEKVGNEEHTRIETPVGELTGIGVRLPTSPWIPFPKKHIVSTIEEFKVLMWVQEHKVWKPSADYTEFNAVVKEVGDDGYVTAYGGISGFQMLLEHYMGVEAFYVTLLEAAELVEAWMELYHKQQKRYIELVAESPAEVVIGYENTSTTNLSPRYYGKYVKNHLDEYADILRGAGKAYVTHDCGKLKGLEELMRGSHQNGYIDVAREPTGDFDFSRRLELTGEKVIIGGIDATAFVTLTPEQMKDHVRELLCDVAPGRYFALGSGDAVPIHTPPEVLRAVGEVVAEEGAYPLSADSVSA